MPEAPAPLTPQQEAIVQARVDAAVAEALEIADAQHAATAVQLDRALEVQRITRRRLRAVNHENAINEARARRDA